MALWSPRCPDRNVAPLGPGQQLGLLRFELLVAEDAVTMQLAELAELVVDVVAAPALPPAGRAQQRREAGAVARGSVGLRAGDRTLLDEATIGDQKQHRRDDRA